MKRCGIDPLQGLMHQGEKQLIQYISRINGFQEGLGDLLYGSSLVLYRPQGA
jgi:hypothetical protein